MIVAAHQPEFIPHLGFFNKIYQSDAFIFMDDVQYKKQTFENRNKIRCNNADGFIYITVPVLKSGGSLPKIKDVEISQTTDWRRRMLTSLEQNYSRAPFFSEVLEIMRSNILDAQYLSSMNISLVKDILAYLGIFRELYLQSELNIQTSKTQLIIDLARFNGENNIFLSGPHGKTYLDRKTLVDCDQQILVTDFQDIEYHQFHRGYIPGMSVVDCLFNHGPGALKFINKSNAKLWI